MKSENTRAYHGSSRGRLGYVDSVRAAAILMVVGIHALGYVELTGSSKALISFTVRTIAVPVFFLCDGFLLSLRFGARELDYRKHLAASAKRLLLPWALFSFFYAGARYVFESLAVVPPVLVVGQSPEIVIANVYASNIAPQMYFLLSLFLIRLLAPVTVKFARAPAAITVSVFVFYTAIYRLAEPFLAKVFSYGLDPVLHGLWGLQFYLLGILLASAIRQIETWGRLAGPILVASAFAARFFAPDTPLAGILVQYSYLMGAFAFFAGLKNRQWVFPKIGRETMGIYLLHAPVLLKILDVAVERLPLTPPARYTLVTMGAFAVSLGLSKILSQIPYGRVIFGELGRRAPSAARATQAARAPRG